MKQQLVECGRIGFLRHRRSIKSMAVLDCVEGRIESNPALAHRLDESRLAIPWQVAPQQSLPPLHQLCQFSNFHSVGSNDPIKPKTFRLDFYMRQRITVRLDFYVRQWGSLDWRASIERLILQQEWPTRTTACLIRR